MKIARFAASLSLLACLLLASAARADEPTPIDVWPGKAPGPSITATKEQWKGKRVTDVTQPTLTLYRPEKNKETGVCVIVCPGGGYKALMMDYEGEDAARWLNTLGITALVLKYRVPAPEGTPAYVPPLQDAQRSLRIVRSHAKEWNLRADRVGILGFSAGANLSAAASTHFDKPAYEPIDDIDKQSCRPDFAVLIYPGGLVEKNADGTFSDRLAPQFPVSAKTPQAFIAQADDDKVGPGNAVFYYLAMKAAGASAELHVYVNGGHGFGLKKTDKTSAAWPGQCAAWMRSQRILSPAREAAAGDGRPSR